jgi:hypothetical protein
VDQYEDSEILQVNSWIAPLQASVGAERIRPSSGLFGAPILMIVSKHDHRSCQEQKYPPNSVPEPGMLIKELWKVDNALPRYHSGRKKEKTSKEKRDAGEIADPLTDRFWQKIGATAPAATLHRLEHCYLLMEPLVFIASFFWKNSREGCF